MLGNGQQRKSYLYVQDCLDAIETVTAKATGKVNIFNLGTAEYCQVIDSIGWICEAMEVKPRLEFTGGERGGVGDNPFIFLDTQRVRALDWQPRLSIREAVQATVRYLLQNRALLDSRE